MKLKPLHQLIKGTTFGQLSLVMLIVCVVSGVFLVVPYDVNNAYYSISLLMLTNSAASFFRNLHYWTAQFFLVFTLIHLYDHFTRRKKIKLGFSLWFRLTVGVIIIFLVMITGFILKGDADAQQAQRIFSELVGMVPFIGSMLQYTFVGDGESLQLIYVHHLATFTLFIVVIVMEHVRTVWPKLSTFLIFTGLIMGLSFLVMAPLHDGLNPVMKGPWYFVGFQELLHLLTHPGYALLLVLAILVLLLIVPYTAKAGWWPKRLLLIITVIYLLSTVVGYFFRGTDWQWIWPWRSTDLGEVYNPVDRANTKVLGFFSDASLSPPHEVMGRNESCMQCHSEMTGFSSSHNPEAIGCYSCHGGNPFSPDKRSAHQGMRLIPGNLSDAQLSCGTTQCHSDIASRIHSGLMATMSGVISVDRFVFNESETPDQLTSVHELQDSPADEHLRNMCVKCHLGNPKNATGPVSESSRGGGCLACHLNYQDFDRGVAFYDTQLSKDTNYLTIHPSIDLKVSNDHCFGCHSRSGRISTNYEGWHETLLEATDISLQDTLYRLVEETRVFRFVQQDVHHKAGMDCIDCHNSYELMGDGNLYAHEEQQTEIACSDCHRDQANQVIKFADLDQESALIASLRYDNIGERVFLTTLKRNRTLINTQVKNDSLLMHSKNSTKTFVLNPPHRACQRGDAHDEVSCSACHSAWAPSCIGCHNAYDDQEPGYNMVLNKEKQGSWVEYVGEYNAHLPAMGIRKTETGQEVIPVVPGMVLTIDLASFTKDKHDSLIFKRLFAPAAPHTTASKGRSCTSCHNNPVALGYGKGKLDFIITNGQGKWRLISHYQDNKHDGLPEDAWVGFLDDRKGEVVSTRTDVFPFTVDQQKLILTVGACLTCHQDDSKIMEQSVINFDSLVSVRSKKCVLPTWPSGNFKP
jgi:hypothetical protein